MFTVWRTLHRVLLPSRLVLKARSPMSALTKLLRVPWGSVNFGDTSGVRVLSQTTSQNYPQLHQRWWWTKHCSATGKLIRIKTGRQIYYGCRIYIEPIYSVGPRMHLRALRICTLSWHIKMVTFCRPWGLDGFTLPYDHAQQCIVPFL